MTADDFIFGRNFPQLSWKACIQSANEDIRLRDDVKGDFFHGNAERVLKLKENKQITKERL
jgi:hypothetical protein